MRNAFCFLMLCSLSGAAVHAESPRTTTKPNIIFVLADDVAQGDLGCYGQKKIATPRLDRLAAEGTRFTQAYSGTSVCAPSRASLMTGLHMGHCPIRGNYELRGSSAFGAGQLPLPESTTTVAEILKSAGYSTACMGKWGMGQFDTSGSPLKKGFDHFFGYNGQVHAHSYFPTYLQNGEARVELPENANNAKKTYAQDLIQRDVIKWVRDNAQNPFFLFYAVTLPHGKYEIDDLGEYADRQGWTQEQKTYAAMVTRLDHDMGELVDTLKELSIDKNSLIIFTGDNGSSFGDNSPNGKFFDQSMGGALRGYKRGLYEGGLRQAALAWWPETIPAGRVSDEPWAFWDFLPTAAELSGADLPASLETDGLSLVSYLKGGKAPHRDYFYWELHEGNPIQAIRFGQWKAIRNQVGGPIELYDLSTDAAERHDLASSQPKIVAKADALMAAARRDNENFPLDRKTPKKKQPNSAPKNKAKAQ